MKEQTLNLGDLDLVCGGAAPVMVRAGTRPREAQAMLSQQGISPSIDQHDDDGASWLGLAAGAVAGFMGLPMPMGGGPTMAVGSVLGTAVNAITHQGTPQLAYGYGNSSPYNYGYPSGYGYPPGYGYGPSDYGYSSDYDAFGAAF